MAALLEKFGAVHLYGVRGSEACPLMEAVDGEGRIRGVGVKKEETGAFAASAEAQLTGRVGVCCGSSPSSSLGLLHGLCDAQRSHASVLGIVPCCPSSGEAEECHGVMGAMKACGIRGERVSSPKKVLEVLDGLLRAVAGKKDAAWLSLPWGTAEAESGDVPSTALPLGQGRVCSGTMEPSAEAVKALAKELNEAESVVFLCGAGCAGAADKVIDLACRLNAPVAYTLKGKEWMEKGNPYAIGMTGPLGWGDATCAIQDADVLVLWGTDFPYRSFLPRHGRVIQIDIDAAALGRHVPLCLAVQGDVCKTVQAVLPLVSKKHGDDFLERSLSRHGREMTRLMARIQETDSTLRPEYLTRFISDHAEPDAIFSIDTGAPLVWAARYLQAFGQRRMVGSFTYGHQACGLAMSIGAKSAYPSRQVIALCSAEGLGRHLDELPTLLSENLCVKILVYNTQEPPSSASRLSGGALPYARLAHAMGLESWKLTQTEDASPVLRQWLHSRGPSLLEAVIDSRDALPQPPDFSVLATWGFSKNGDGQLMREELDADRRVLFGARSPLGEKRAAGENP